MLVRDYMTTEVFSVHVDDHLIVNDEILKWRRIREIPVVGPDDALIGLIRHRDLLLAALDAARHGGVGTSWRVPVRKVMHMNPHSIGPGATIQDAAAIMRKEKAGCLPVVERGKLVGIITEYDFLPIVESL